MTYKRSFFAPEGLQFLQQDYFHSSLVLPSTGSRHSLLNKTSHRCLSICKIFDIDVPDVNILMPEARPASYQQDTSHYANPAADTFWRRSRRKDVLHCTCVFRRYILFTSTPQLALFNSHCADRWTDLSACTQSRLLRPPLVQHSTIHGHAISGPTVPHRCWISCHQHTLNINANGEVLCSSFFDPTLIASGSKMKMSLNPLGLTKGMYHYLV
ncbi:uncharacterized protein EDB91DRAFT_130804 [Suillus paluster]|uniref:uncharacterized protein n=1 Tax=Suillus paluster TaxID=48578 RepID=UPI001B87A6E1|nr:uncharacterized protein EDB91DRAFT_130804 [Suillus paluster]KAG1745911.1 hypothetical protein EDB91DRAFT_130804 [Suillus paluster]